MPPTSPIKANGSSWAMNIEYYSHNQSNNISLNKDEWWMNVDGWWINETLMKNLLRSLLSFWSPKKSTNTCLLMNTTISSWFLVISESSSWPLVHQVKVYNLCMKNFYLCFVLFVTLRSPKPLHFIPSPKPLHFMPCPWYLQKSFDEWGLQWLGLKMFKPTIWKLLIMEPYFHWK